MCSQLDLRGSGFASGNLPTEKCDKQKLKQEPTQHHRGAQDQQQHQGKHQGTAGAPAEWARNIRGKIPENNIAIAGEELRVFSVKLKGLWFCIGEFAN